SVAVWYFGAEHDLRLYAIVQYGTMLAVPVLLWLRPAKHYPVRYLGYALGFYVLAKVCEVYDAKFFSWTGQLLRGHSLKHLLSGGAVAFVVQMLLLDKIRVPLERLRQT